MPEHASFVVSPSPDRVAAYLSDPRNVLVANNDGPVVDRSDPPHGPGSWSVLAFDQLRIRVEYTAAAPDRVAVAATYAGRGSGGITATASYGLQADPSGGTRVSLEADGSGGFFVRAMNRLTWPLVWRRIRDRMDKGAVGPIPAGDTPGR
jgi:hypothetical protein